MTHDEQEAEWTAWERRNPGVAHPDRIKARRAQGKREHDADWAQGTLVFQQDGMSLSERARVSRETGRGRHFRRLPRTPAGDPDETT